MGRRHLLGKAAQSIGGNFKRLLLWGTGSGHATGLMTARMKKDMGELMQKRKNAAMWRVLRVQKNQRQRLVRDARATHFLQLHAGTLEYENALRLHRRAPRVQGLIGTRRIHLRPPRHAKQLANVVSGFLRIHTGMQCGAEPRL